MLRLKLHSVLRTHDISETDLADAIASIVANTRAPVSERHLRYLKRNTALLTPDNKARKPSLVMLGLIIRGLRQLTGGAVDIADVLEYVADPEESATFHGADSGHANRDPRRANDAAEEAVLVAAGEEASAFAVLDRVIDLTIHYLWQRGHREQAVLFGEAASEGSWFAAAPPRRRLGRRWLILALALLLSTALAVFSYDRMIIQPKLLAASGGIFAFRDRIKATSDLALPTLIGPEGEVDGLEPVLRVSEVRGALAYEFYVENRVSGDGVYTGPLPKNTFPIPNGTLCPNTAYAWRVRALGEDGWTSFSSALDFSVSADAVAPSQQWLLALARIKTRPAPPVMQSPLGLASSVTPMLAVEPADDVMGYGFYIRDLQTDQVIYNNNFALTNQVQIPAGLLKEGGIYQWNTRARNCHYWSEFTPAQVFKVDAMGGN